MTTLLEIARRVALNTEMDPPASVVTTNDKHVHQLLDLLNLAGREIAERVDWATLMRSVAMPTTGTGAPYDLPSDFGRLIRVGAVRYQGEPVLGLTPAEWASTTPVEGPPRYYLLRGTSILFYPYPPSGETVVVNYVSRNWIEGGTLSAFTADGDQPDIDADLIAKNTMWRWRRQYGGEYADHMAEFEADLLRRAAVDTGDRLA